MNKKWMPITAGILNIISGAVQLLVSIRAFQWPFSDEEAFTKYVLSPEYTLEGYLLRFFIPFFISGLIAIGGGINATKRDTMLGLVWAGAIAASFPLLISQSFLSETFALVFGNKAYTLTGLLGIASLILIGQYKIDFIEQYQVWRRAINENWARINQRWMTVNKTWKPIVAGILEILAGIVMFYVAFLFLFLIGVEAPRPLEPWYFLWPLAPGFLGVLSLVGGVCAVIRRRWRLAFMGAIATIPGLMLLPRGVHHFDAWYFQLWYFFIVIWPLLPSVAIIALIVLSKREFK